MITKSARCVIGRYTLFIITWLRTDAKPSANELARFAEVRRKKTIVKYRHTYSEEMMHKNIDDAVNAIYQIERTLLRREPTIARWRKYHMANADKWYYAYKIDGGTIKILDACHAQNMRSSESNDK